MKLIRPLLLVSLTLLSSLGLYGAFSLFKQQKPPPVPIRSIAQTGPVKEALKTACIAEILSLSEDNPQPITPEKAQELLEKHPAIQKADVSLLNPQTLYIDYVLKTPQFIIGDVENLALDSQGTPLPLAPFYTPKRLPTLYLGDERYQEKREIALKLLDILGEEITMIDVSQAFAPSLGQREIIVFYGPHILRLSSKRMEQELSRLKKIESRLGKSPLVLDLRMDHLAFIHPIDQEFCNDLLLFTK